MYRPATDGLSGNDDCGQMSAWYIFSSLGFYPVAPGSDEYEIGSPSVKRAVINLENGSKFIIEAKNQSDKNVYVQKVLLNGAPLFRPTLKHSDIVNGGSLIYEMGPKPNKKLYE
jgi:putative alpha-1,2-mannosidase